jgi:hypothetical protein
MKINYYYVPLTWLSVRARMNLNGPGKIKVIRAMMEGRQRESSIG